MLFTLTLCAADVSGTWSGTLKIKQADGSEGSDSAYLILKQDGKTVTGTAGGGVNDQHLIQNGRIEGDQVTLEVQRASGSIMVSLKLQPDGKTLKGNIQRQRNGETQTAQLEVTRDK